MTTELTTEELVCISENRKRALGRREQAKTQQRAQNAKDIEGNYKDPASSNGDSGKSSEAKSRHKLRASKMSSGYYEYDLSKMRDTKGGFLEPDPQTARPEKKRKIIPLDDIPYSLNPDENPKCTECGSLDLDIVYLKIYKTKVCKQCIERVPDKYSLLTKTEAKEDYLLTDSELRDRERLPVWEKPNPHKMSWNNMLLYLRMHLEAFAMDKWGTLENLDQEFARREEEKKLRKEKKFRRSVAELRKRTRVEEWEKKRSERLKLEKEHEHAFEPVGDDDSPEQKCTVCGLVVEVEEF